MGVDVFLCLSAFLFARLLLVEYRERRDIDIAHFYIRRAFRIWPVYFVFSGMMLALAVRDTGVDHNLPIRSLGVATFTDNLFGAVQGLNVSLAYSFHLWTISYEEQFYAVVPWVLRVFYQSTPRTIAYVLGSVVSVGTILRAVAVHIGLTDEAIRLLPFTHFESIIGGLVLGLGLADGYLEQARGWVLLVAGLAALWLVTMLPRLVSLPWNAMLWSPVVGAGVSLVLFAVLRGDVWGASALLGSGLFRYLGKISYGLYVYHVASQALALRVTEGLGLRPRLLGNPAVMLIASLTITVAVASVSYQLLEKPFLRLKNRFAFVHSRPI
jgi:peptidoglycan/LPS O-acetylase OafA/YrhL